MAWASLVKLTLNRPRVIRPEEGLDAQIKEMATSRLDRLFRRPDQWRKRSLDEVVPEPFSPA
jgi:hypothetical protein